MAANTVLLVSDVTPDGIKQNLKATFQSDTVFQDYNFEGSALSLLTNILTHDTYYRAFYINMAYNEAFLDSSIRRTSVVSRAKDLNYVPRSVRGATAKLLLTVFPEDSPAFVTVPSGTRFRGTREGLKYTFSTQTDYTILNDNGTYQKEILVHEGDAVTQTYTVPDSEDPIIIKLINQNIDTDTLTVTIKETINSTQKADWTLVDDILDVEATSKIYYLFENMDGYYELHFGNDVLGQKPDVGNVIEVNYLVSNGTAANDIASFSDIDDIDGYNSFSISLVERSSGGQEREDVESIKFNAPRNYDMQNRCVTNNDYKQFILNRFSDIQAITVWGGEENDPPMYGKVYICIKPFNGYTITETRKADINLSISKYNVHTIESVFVDPTFIYIVPSINVYYNPRTTVLSADGIRTKIQNKVIEYEANNLGIFDKKFRLSKFSSDMDRADTSIVSNDTSIKVQKRFNPVLNSRYTYIFPFHTQLLHPFTNYEPILSSSGFTIPTSESVMYLDDYNGKIRMYYQNRSTRTYVNNNCGSIDYTTGKVILENFVASSVIGDELKINVIINGKDFAPTRNQILLISDTVITIFDDITGSVVSKGTVTTTGTTETLEEVPIITTVTV